jgi:hypothetical protein
VSAGQLARHNARGQLDAANGGIEALGYKIDLAVVELLQ